MKHSELPQVVVSPSGNSGRGRLKWGIFIAAAMAVTSILATDVSGQGGFQFSLQNPFSWSQFDPPDAPPATKAMLARGQALYDLNCSYCHGTAGAGDGWRGAYLTPKPRDFTRGVYRFKTTESGTLPTDRDLFRTLSTGIQNTAMPAWSYYLAEQDRWALVEYIKGFSSYFREEPPGEPIGLGPQPAFTADRVERGRELYAKAGCADCHGPQGYGDGFAAEGMEDSFGAPIAPRNFHSFVEFKRGRTLRDIALTIQTGNDGSPMPSFHNALNREQVWDLASFILSLPVETPTFQRPGCLMRTATGGGAAGLVAGPVRELAGALSPSSR